MADNIDVTSGSGNTVAADEITDGTLGTVKVQYVKIMNGDIDSSTKYGATNPFPVTGTITGITNSIAVHVLSTGGTIQTKLDPSSVLAGIGSSVAVYFSPSNPAVAATFSGSMAVYFDGSSPTVRVVNGATTLNVALDPGHSLGTIEGINSTVHVDFSGSNPSVNVGSPTITGITNSIAVHVLSTGGTITVKTDPSSVIQISNTPSVNVANFSGMGHTASIFSASGSSAAAATGGITIISPSAGYNFKIFAYSIQTTGVLASALTFANGNSASQTEFWRPLVACGGSGAQSTTPLGANLAVTPPGYIFATGTNTTLAIAGNNGSTIHYSVSYIKETS